MISGSCLPTSCSGREEKLYNVPPSCATLTKGDSVATKRFFQTDKDHVLDCHLDKMNPRDIDNLDNSDMNTPIACLAAFDSNNSR